VGGGGREGERRQMVAAMVAKWMFSMGRVFHFLFLFCFFFFFFFCQNRGFILSKNYKNPLLTSENDE